MKAIELSLLDRLTLINLLDQFKTVGGFTSNMEKLAHMLDDVKQVGLSEEEKTAAKVVQDSENPALIRFDAAYDGKKTVEFNDSTVDFVRAFLKDKDEKGEVTVADRNLIHVKELFV